MPKKLQMVASIDDNYTSAHVCTVTICTFAKIIFDTISMTHSYVTPDLWKEAVFTKSPYHEFTDNLVKTHTRVCSEDPSSRCGYHAGVFIQEK